MKKLCSLLLAAAMLATVVFCPTAGVLTSAETTTASTETWSITNTYDEAGITKDLVSGTNIMHLGVKAASEVEDGVLQFEKASSKTATGNDISHIKIYDPSDESFAVYKPEKNTVYKLTFEYKSRSASGYDVYFNVRGVKDGVVCDDVLVRAVTVNKNSGLNSNSSMKWDTATVYFNTGDNDFSALAICAESGSAYNQSLYPYLNNISLSKAENFVVSNTYEEDAITADTIKATNVFDLGTKAYSSSARLGKTIQLYPITGQTEIANGNITYVEIYDPNNNYASFVPAVNTSYKITFDFKVKASSYGNISFNIRSVNEKALGEVLATAAIVAKDNSSYSDYAWGTASIIVTTGKTQMSGLALSIETDTESNAELYPYLDNILVQKVEYGAIVNDYDDEGVYYTTSSSEEDNYGNWRRKTDAANTFYSGTSIDGTSIREAVFAKGIMSESGFDQSRGYSFKKAYRTDYTGTPDFVSIYDSFDSDRSMYIPENNVTYKIRFKYKSETVKYASALHLNMYGLTSTTESIGTSKELLNTLLIIPKNTTVTEWTEAVGYFTVENDYNGLLLSLVTTATDETTVASGTTAKFSIDDIVITKMGSFAIDNAAVKGEQTDGFAPLDSTETALFTVNAGDSIKLDYKMSNTATGVKLAVQFFADEPSVIDYGIDGEIVDLFEITETNASSVTYNTTITAPISGYAVVIAYTDGEAVTDAGILVEDFNAQVYTPDLLKGDTNLDGALNLKDLVNTKKAIAMNYRLGGDYMVNSDLDKTGNIAAGDLVVIRQLLLGTYDNTDTLAIDLAYDFANETAGSAEGTITLTSKEAVDNYIDLYWGADGKPIADCYYIGSTAISAGSTAEIAMDARLAIPDGATQIILSDGLDNAIFDIPESKLADGSFSPYSISLVKDYTVGENIANVSVVYPATAESNTYNIACEFRNELTDILGAEVEFIADTETLDSNSYYILLGKTSVNESATALNEIITDRADYNGDYIIRETNKKIVVTADNDYALQLAIDDFFSNYCTSDESLITAGMNYKSSQYNELGSITIAGTSIENYTVVYPETASILEVDAADYLVSNVLKKTGKLLNVTNDTAEAGSYEILIGNTNRTNEEYATTAAGNVDNSYSISVGANATSIVGSSNSATNAGVIDFTARILKGAVSEGTYTGSYDGSYSLTNGYKLTWSDEFSGTELSDTWGFCDTDDYDTVKGGKTEFLMENATVSGGTLKATSYMDGNDSKGLGIYTRGTNSKYFKYGYFEARIKLSDIQGFTTSFWMTTIGKKMGDLTCYGEFDILEMYTTNNTVHPNLHNHSTAENHKNYLQGTGALKPSISTTDPLGEKFHNFGMEWTDDYIYFYLDGVRYFSFDCTLLPEYVVFDQLASISMTFNAGLYVEPTVDSSVAYVDWVRVWQKDEAGYVIK